MDRTLVTTFAPWFSHGLAVQVQDLPLPLSSFYYGAAAALGLSFLLLVAGFRSARLEQLAEGVPLRTGAPGFARACARASRVVAAVLAVAWLVSTVGAALWGSSQPDDNPAPTLVFVLAWIGLPLVAVLLGVRGALALHPIAVVARLGGLRERTSTPPPAWLGVWAAWAGLAVFTWLELVYPTSAHVVLVGVLVLAWTLGGLALASRYGRTAWLEHIDPFGTYARLIGSLAPWSRRADGRTGLRPPLIGPNHDIPGEPGLVALTTLLIGTVSYDGLTRTGWWQERVGLATADLTSHGMSAANGRMLFGTFGLVALALLAWLVFELGAWAGARVGRLQVGRGTRRAAQQFAPSLLPIALAYVVAHYCSFFLVQVQELVRLASDPFAQGWDLFGTAERTARDLHRPSGTTVWLVEVIAIVVGHVAGLLLAHDRAIRLAPLRADGTPDLRRVMLSQVPVLALMLVYTVGGLYFLSEGLS